MRTKELSLYLHIPFCIQKCKYCDFLSFSRSEEDRNSYIQELVKEIADAGKDANEYRVISIFFGGGTPSILTGEQMTLLMNTIRESFHLTKDAEITMESNPGTLTKEKLIAYKNAGINRLSMGLQSTDDRELRMLGRIHDYQTFLNNYHMAREVGFDNVNVDLMSALPYQTMESYEETLRKVAELQPEHISAYSLIIEEGTPIASDEELLDHLPDEDCDRDMYAMTKRILKEYGYERYEISNYAKPGYACRHNCVYWQGGDYLGFGLGASSYYKGRRYHNETDFSRYRFDSPKQDVEVLTKTDQMEEFMFLGLRMTEGIQAQDFHERFGVTLREVYGDILQKQEEEGLIETDGHNYRLTERGLDVSNYVFCDYLFD